MRIIDSHFHWWPREVLEQLSKRSGYPCAKLNERGGYTYIGHEGRPPLRSWAEWFDLDRQLEHMDRLGHEVSVVCSLGPLSIYFSDLSVDEGRAAAIALRGSVDIVQIARGFVVGLPEMRVGLTVR